MSSLVPKGYFKILVKKSTVILSDLTKSISLKLEEEVSRLPLIEMFNLNSIIGKIMQSKILFIII